MFDLDGFQRAFAQEQKASIEGETPLDWAKAYLWRGCAPGQDGDLPFVSRPLSIESLLLYEAVKVEMARSVQLSDIICAQIARLALSDWDCDALGRHIVLRATMESWQLPPTMKQFTESVIDGAKPPAKRGERYWKLRNRDRLGAAVLMMLTAQDGFALVATRSVATNGTCACDVLVKAGEGLGWASITTANADEIWRHRRRLWSELFILNTLGYLRKAGRTLSVEIALAFLAEIERQGPPSG